MLLPDVKDAWMDTLNTKIVIGSAAASGVFLPAGILTFMIVLMLTVIISAFIASRGKTPNPNLILAAGTPHQRSGSHDRPRAGGINPHHTPQGGRLNPAAPTHTMNH